MHACRSDSFMEGLTGVSVIEEAAQLQEKSVWSGFIWLFCNLLRQVAAWYREIWNANPFSGISIGTAVIERAEREVASPCFHSQPWPLQIQNGMDLFGT